MYIKDYLFSNSEELYDRTLYRIFRNMPQVKTTKLYAIVRTKSLIFDFKSFSINMNYDITCNIVVNDTFRSITFNLMEMYYDQFGKEHQNIEVFKNELETILLTQVDFGEKIKLTKETLCQKISPYKEQENSKNLILTCPFYYILSNRQASLISLNVYRVLNMFKINLINKLEIIYIGKAIKDTMKRLKNHNKWGEVLNLDKQSKKDNYDYLVYVFNLDKADTYIYNIDKNNIFIFNDNSNFELKSAVKNLEIAFISYYKPILNEKHINTDFSKTKFVTQELITLGYNRLIIEMNFEDGSVMGNIKTPQVNKQAVEIDINIE